MSQQFVCVGIEIETQRCVGVDFCKNEEELRWKADMFHRDFGEGYLIIEHPSRGDAIATTAVEVMALACERSAFEAAQTALTRIGQLSKS
ncbi:hypothetical protein [Burkholderia pseudomallei]|uniref:Uncharacterized protein n=1 Tax=Burkholderia pseudomallei TaxID=28450 RepID=A0AA40JJE0_BURPE|nr:hypothetical protein [Burkholderia pseudomallei]KGS89661.1 hypothetical protein X942_6501 [Burkholderia pseudomallei MSHR5596]KGX17257.1 hypothetical protein Y036_6170 [Burkholderia pseudomallei]